MSYRIVTTHLGSIRYFDPHIMYCSYLAVVIYYFSGSTRLNITCEAVDYKPWNDWDDAFTFDDEGDTSDDEKPVDTPEDDSSGGEKRHGKFMLVFMYLFLII